MQVAIPAKPSTLFVVLNPYRTGSVLLPVIRSPSISSASLLISLNKVSKKANAPKVKIRLKTIRVSFGFTTFVPGKRSKQAMMTILINISILINKLPYKKLFFKYLEYIIKSKTVTRCQR